MSQQTMHQNRLAEEKGQSGEAISDQDYMTTLGLMAGHLLVAQDLLAAGDVKGADPHVGHPLAELYADVAPRLEVQTQVPLKTELNRCQQMIDQAQAPPAIQACVTQSLKLVDRAIALLPERQRSQPPFQRQVLKQVLQTAASEYDEAIAEGRFAETVEYQDGLGFVRFAQALPLSQKDANLSAQLKQIAQAWPSIQPPAKPLVSVEQLRQQIEQIVG
jgi:hypothetical protein